MMFLERTVKILIKRICLRETEFVMYVNLDTFYYYWELILENVFIYTKICSIMYDSVCDLAFCELNYR